MMSFLRVCRFIINFLILFSFAFNGSAAFDLLEKRQLEADLAQTDRDFIALLKKTIARRIYLFGETLDASVAAPSEAKLFPALLEDADNDFVKSFLLPRSLADSWAVIFSESREVLNAYAKAIDEAAPLEDADLREFLRITSPLGPAPYSRILEVVEGFDTVESLKEYYDEVVTQTKVSRVVDVAGFRNWKEIRADFINAENEFFRPGRRYHTVGMQQLERGEFQEAKENFREALTFLELAYGAFRIAINNNPGSHYIPHARFRLGDSFIEEAYVLIDDGEPQKAADRLRDAIELYQFSLRLYPTHDRAEYVWFMLGHFAYDQGNVREAEGDYMDLVNNFPMNTGKLQLTDNAQFMIGVCQSDRGQIALAKDSLNGLTAYAGNLFTKVARIQLAHLESPIQLDQQELASNPAYQGEYGALHDIDSENIESLVVLGDLLSDQANFVEAIHSYSQAIALYENLQENKDSKQAENRFVPLEFERQWYYKALLGKSQTLLNKGKDDLEIAQGDQGISMLRKCVQTLEKLVELEPDLPVQRAAYLLLGDSYYDISKQSNHIEDYENTVMAYEDAKKHRHLSVNRNYRLADAYLFLKNPQQATALLEEQVEDLKWLVSQGGDVKAHKIDLDLTHLTLGAIHRSQRRYTKALENYSKVQGEIYRDEATVSISQINNLRDKLQPEDFNE